MPKSGPITPRIRPETLALPALVAGLALAACSGDNNNGGGTTGLPASTNYAGIWASTGGGFGSSGALTITFATAVKAPPAQHSDIAGASAAPISATGEVEVNGSPVAIDGSLDGSTLHMTGPNNLTLDGTLSNGVITGTFTGPDDGSFVAASNSEGTPAYTFCGYYSGTVVADQSTEEGTFSLIIVGSIVEGVAYDGGGSSEGIGFSGTATAGQTAGSGTFKIKQSNTSGTLTINDGTYSAAGGVEGSYTTSTGTTTVSNGTFYSGPTGCPVL